MQKHFLLRLICFAFAITSSKAAMSDSPGQVSSDTLYQPGAAQPRDSFRSEAGDAIASLDSLLKPVDPLKLFPQLSSMGIVAIPKGYIVLLVGFLGVGGLLIFVADIVRSNRAGNITRKKRPKKARHADDYQMQSAFEAFVITLFDPLYFRHTNPKRKQAVMAGNFPQIESTPNLEFEFSHKETYARFAVRCHYFKYVDTDAIQLFPPGRYQRFKDFENATGMPLYLVLGFGGAPDDPKELFLVPANALKREVVPKESIRRYSKSGMFFYNSVAGGLQ